MVALGAQSFYHPSLGQAHLEAGMFSPDLYHHFREKFAEAKNFQ